MAARDRIFLPRRWVIVALAPLLLLIGQSARALMTLDLVPQVAGPYAPSSVVDVDVVLNNFEGVAVQPRLVTLDFSATDPALSLPGVFSFQLVPPLMSDLLYARFEAMPKVDLVYSSISSVPGFILDIPNGGALTLGTISIGLPATDGVYTLDAINVAAPDTSTGARIDYGFAMPTTVHHLNGNLQGGAVDLQVGVIPEPTTFALLAFGVVGIGLARRRD